MSNIKNNPFINLTAAQAVAMLETNARWRAGHCFTLMNATLNRIAELSISDKRTYVAESIGSLVNIDVYITELSALGYKAELAGKQYVARTVIINW